MFSNVFGLSGRIRRLEYGLSYLAYYFIYFIQKIIGSHCLDKALSIGEKSNLFLKYFLVENSRIGVSSKDLSTTKIDFVKIKNVNFCYEAFQKKQEFGGGKINFNIIECNKKHLVDKNSSVLIGMK